MDIDVMTRGAARAGVDGNRRCDAGSAPDCSARDGVSIDMGAVRLSWDGSELNRVQKARFAPARSLAGNSPPSVLPRERQTDGSTAAI